MKKGPEKIVVHCSAGVGRTGTFISLVNLTGECVLTEKKPDMKIKIFQTVRLLREQRLLMVERKVFL